VASRARARGHARWKAKDVVLTVDEFIRQQKLTHVAVQLDTKGDIDIGDRGDPCLVAPPGRRA